MSNIDKRALREAANAANAASWGNWEPYKPHKGARGYEVKVGVKAVAQHCLKVDSVFIASANPSTVLALLDELEEKDKRLNEILTPNMLLPVTDDMDEDNLRHVIKTVCENYSLLHAKWEAAEKRIAGLTGKPANEYSDDADLLFEIDFCDDLSTSIQVAQWLKELRIRRAAGIITKVGE